MLKTKGEAWMESSGQTARRPGAGAVLVIGLIAMLLAGIWAYRKEQGRKWRAAIADLHQQISPGQDREEAVRTIEAAWPPEYFRRENMVVRTPMEFGAHNWILLLDFSGEKVAAVAVRTDDTHVRPPDGAPPDKTAPGFVPFWQPE